MLWITHPPQCLGVGATSLPTKVRLTLHIFWMLCVPPRLHNLMECLKNFVSFTTDLGTESGIASFEAPSVRSVMPTWMFPQPDRLQPVDEDAGGDLDEAMADAEAERKRVFENSMVVPGILHICHNLSAKVDKAMPYFDTFLNGLKAVVTLLHYKDNRQLFIEKCVRGTPFDTSGRSALNRGVPSTAEWRWGSIISILDRIVPLKALLRITFDATKMKAAAEAVEAKDPGDAEPKQKEGKLNLPLIQSTVRDGRWWGFAEMLQGLHGVIQAFGRWCESCPCHGFMGTWSKGDCQAFAELRRAAGLTDEFDGPGYQCPMCGIRAPELAAFMYEPQGRPS